MLAVLRCGSSMQPMLLAICLQLIAFGPAQSTGSLSNAGAAVGHVQTAVKSAGPAPIETKQQTTVLTTAATTKKAQKPKRLCALPFWYRGGWQHECLEYGTKGARWCSLTQNFTKDEMWQECARYDLMRYKCTVPFQYQGKSHSNCQLLGLEPLAKPTFWCSLIPRLTEITWAGLGTDWVFCEAPNATDSAYLKAVGQHRSLKEAAARTKTTVIHPMTTAIHPKTTVMHPKTTVMHPKTTVVHPKTTVIHPKPETAAAVVTTAPSTTPNGTSVHAVTGIQGNPAGAQKSISAASADGAAASSADRASASGAHPGSGLGIALGVVGVVLTTVAVAAAFIVHRRHQYKRIDPLLSTEPAAEKSSYGGMQAYHD